MGYASRIALMASACLIPLALGFIVPASLKTAQAINIANNTVTLDLNIADDQDSATATKDTQIVLGQDYADGYIVYASAPENTALYNVDIRDAKFVPTQPASSLDQLSTNSYGIKTELQGYHALSSESQHPTKVTSNKEETTSGTTVNITYAAKADKTMPQGAYHSEDAAIHFEIVPDVYHLTYANYGTEEKVVEQKHNATFTLEPAPTKTGYNFEGYNTNADASGITYHPDDQLTLDYIETTLYTIWQAKTITTTFNANGGTFDGGVATKNLPETYDGKYTLPENPTRTGYTFKGWFTQSSGGEQVTTETTVTNPDSHTLYAHWEANKIQVTFDHNDSAGSKETKVETYDSHYELPNVPTYIGYTFKGWFTQATGGTEVTSSTKVTNPDSHTLYAHWEANTYNLKYDANTTDTVTGMPSSQSQSGNPAFTVANNTPARTGYNFKGWASSKTATTPEYQPSGSITLSEPTSGMTSEKTLYAVWEAKTHNISYDLDGGSYGNKHPDTATYNADVEISNPTKTQHTFKGWKITGMDTNTHYYGDTTSYGNTSTATTLENITATHFKNLNATNNSTVTFTAVWERDILPSCETTVPLGPIYMQDFNSLTDKVKMITEVQYKLIDKRDNKSYCVSLLKDGKVWMTQNLDLDLSSSTPLTSADSDVTSSWTPQTTYDASSQWTSSDNTNINSLDLGDFYYDGSTIDNDHSFGATYSNFNGFLTPDNPNINQHYHVGNLYSWNASTAGTGGTITSKEATDSICPKGWRLPINNAGGEFHALMNIYGITSGSSTTGDVSKVIAEPLYMVRGGYVGSGRLWFAASHGAYWAATADTNLSYADSFYFSGVDHIYVSYGVYRYYGHSVRCVAN